MTRLDSRNASRIPLAREVSVTPSDVDVKSLFCCALAFGTFKDHVDLGSKERDRRCVIITLQDSVGFEKVIVAPLQSYMHTLAQAVRARAEATRIEI